MWPGYCSITKVVISGESHMGLKVGGVQSALVLRDIVEAMLQAL